MIVIPMTPEQYAKAKSVVESSDQVISKSEAGPNVGTFKTSQVELSYKYENASLDIIILAKHGLAKFASEDTIKQHLEDLLKSV